MDKKLLYKIRRKDGKFSSGGHPPKFIKTGKIWPLPQLKAHMRLIQNYGGDFSCYNDCELVTYEEKLSPSELTLEKFLDDYKQELVVKKLKGI